MRESVLVPLGLVMALAGVPAWADQVAPTGGETNPLGTLRWLPDNANEKTQVPANRFRLVVAYDFSLNEQGQAVPLLGKGPFGLKFYSTSVADFRMKAHSDAVDSLDEVGGDAVDPVDEAFAGVAGDVRDGDCRRLGGALSSAYSTTRSFFHPGADPYQPVNAPGACEQVDASTPADGGFQTTVTTFVPGFWIDVEWPSRSLPLGLGTGRVLPEVWYGTYYDDDGEDGQFYEVGDATGDSRSVGSPGDYDLMFSFTAGPGAIGEPCPGFPGVTDAAPGSWQDVKVQVPEGTTRATFKLFPKGDWDLRVLDPEGTAINSGFAGGFEETVNFPGAGGELISGEYIFRACNYTGEQTTFGAVILQ